VRPSDRLTLHRNWLLDILGLALILFIFYTIWLNSYPFFTPDEGRYAEVAREMVASGDYITPRVNGVAFLDKPILYYWLQAIAIALFGVKEWAIRLFPVLLGILGCLVTYITGRCLFDRRTGLLSAILLATTPLYFIGAHYANLDLEVAVLISSALLFFITGVQSQGSRRTAFLLTAYAFSALACLTKGLIGIAFPAMIAGVWIALLGHWRLLKKAHLISGIALFCAMVIPWYLLVQQANPDFLHYFFVTQHFSRFLSSTDFNNPTPFWFYLPVVLIGFFPWTIFLYGALKQAITHVWQARTQHQTELFLLLWVAIIFTFFSIPTSKIVTYILPIFPALALLLGHYLSCTLKSTSLKTLRQYIISLFILTALLVAALVAAHTVWADFPLGFKPYLIAIAIVLIANALASLLVLKRKKLALLLALCVTSSALILSLLTMGATHLNNNSAKPLITYLNTILQPQDEVIHYFKYYYDVPLYLERRVTIVNQWDASDIAKKDNWARELWNGMAFQDTKDWLINEDTFWQHWKSDKRVFVFLNANYFDQFKEKATAYFHLGKHNDIILLSNKPTVINTSK
jgi:4-amino-4-deoxy-L-arabinose transferase-like glycosyltransferase